MYTEIGGQHNLPHIHARYQDDDGVYDLDGNCIKGKLPRKQTRLLEAWIELHRDEIEANWNLAQAGEKIFRIDPLK